MKVGTKNVLLHVKEDYLEKTAQGVRRMNTLELRITIYSALALLCSAVSALAGPVAAIWSFVQMAVVIELLYALAQPVRIHTESFKSVK